MYEWNYPRQLLEIRMIETASELDRAAATRELFTETFLIRRPLLRAIEDTRERAPVLLIDEIDRADEEFEGYLLEFLSDFQVTIPELGTIRAEEPPVVVITSNRTREVHDALKRRCVYSWIPYPAFEKEYRIVTSKVPGASERLARAGHGVRAGSPVRRICTRPPASPRRSIGRRRSSRSIATCSIRDVVDETLGILLKNQEDIDSVRGDRVAPSSLAHWRRAGPAELCMPRDVTRRRSFHNLLLFGRVLRAAGRPCAPRADGRRHSGHRMDWAQQPRRSARDVVRAARPSARRPSAFQRSLRPVLPHARVRPG